MKITKKVSETVSKIALVFVILMIIGSAVKISTLRNPSPAVYHSALERRLKNELGDKMTPAMLEEGKTLLSKLPKKDYSPYIWERGQQQQRVIDHWYFYSLLAGKGMNDRAEDFRPLVDQTLSAN